MGTLLWMTFTVGGAALLVACGSEQSGSSNVATSAAGGDAAGHSLTDSSSTTNGTGGAASTTLGSTPTVTSTSSETGTSTSIGAGAVGGSGGATSNGSGGASSQGTSSNTSSSGTGVGGSGGNGSGGNGSGGNGSGGNGSGGMVGQVPSPGCSAAEPPASGRFSIDVEGTQREYILKLPESYQPAEPYRLIFAWHGLMYSADWVASGDPPATGPYFGIEAEAQGSAIFVAPQALSGGWSNQDGRDVAFLDAMLQVLLAELCIDESRIFSTGFSFGGIMTLTLGCERSETFRAIAPMSGSLRNDCPGNQPVAYWSSHGDVDMTITIAEGEMARDAFVERNGCSSETLEAEPAGCVSYQGCSEGHPVTWCVFSGAHEPPPFAGVAIWSFFEQF